MDNKFRSFNAWCLHPVSPPIPGGEDEVDAIESHVQALRRAPMRCDLSGEPTRMRLDMTLATSLTQERDAGANRARAPHSSPDSDRVACAPRSRGPSRPSLGGLANGPRCQERQEPTSIPRPSQGSQGVPRASNKVPDFQGLPGGPKTFQEGATAFQGRERPSEIFQGLSVAPRVSTSTAFRGLPRASRGLQGRPKGFQHPVPRLSRGGEVPEQGHPESKLGLSWEFARKHFANVKEYGMHAEV